MKIILRGAPVTKKNSGRIVYAGGRPRVLPSKAYTEYERGCLKQITSPPEPISRPVCVRCVYYMPTRRRVDMVNLIEASMDILVKAGVLADDHSGIAASHDGSRVLYDKQNPRAEITITPFEG